MDNNLTPGSGTTATFLSIFSGIFCVITLKDVQAIVTITAGMVGIVSGLYAARYWRIATKEKKQNLKSK